MAMEIFHPNIVFPKNMTPSPIYMLKWGHHGSSSKGQMAKHTLNQDLPSGKFTQTLAVIGVGSYQFPLKLGYFQGPTVNLPDGIFISSCYIPLIFLASSTSSIIQNAMKNHTKTTVDEVTKSNAYMIKIDEI